MGKRNSFRRRRRHLTHKTYSTTTQEIESKKDLPEDFLCLLCVPKPLINFRIFRMSRREGEREERGNGEIIENLLTTYEKAHRRHVI